GRSGLEGLGTDGTGPVRRNGGTSATRRRPRAGRGSGRRQGEPLSLGRGRRKFLSRGGRASRRHRILVSSTCKVRPNLRPRRFLPRNWSARQLSNAALNALIDGTK